MRIPNYSKHVLKLKRTAEFLRFAWGVDCDSSNAKSMICQSQTIERLSAILGQCGDDGGINYPSSASDFKFLKTLCRLVVEAARPDRKVRASPCVQICGEVIGLLKELTPDDLENPKIHYAFAAGSAMERVARASEIEQRDRARDSYLSLKFNQKKTAKKKAKSAENKKLARIAYWKELESRGWRKRESIAMEVARAFGIKERQAWEANPHNNLLQRH